VTKPKGDKDSATMIVDLPGALDRFVSGTGAAQGDDGETPFYVAYRNAQRITRGRGYTLRLAFPVAHADEVLNDLKWFAADCVSSNVDQIHEASARSEVAAARKVADHCEGLLTELQSTRVDSVTAMATEEPVPLAAKWYAEPHADGFTVTNGTDYLTDYNGQRHVYSDRKTADRFATGATARDRDRQTRPRYRLTVLDGKEIRWIFTPAIRYSATSVSREYRAVVSIVDPGSGKPARLIDVDDVEETERVIRLSGKPLGYTKFSRILFTSPSFDKFAQKYPHYADLVQGINEGRGITREVRRNGDDTEGLWS